MTAKTFKELITVAKTFNDIRKFNPYHDRLGRFTTSNGASSFTIRTKDPSQQHLADRAVGRAQRSYFEELLSGAAEAPRRAEASPEEKLAKDGFSKEVQRTKPQVLGPKQTQAFIDSYMEQHAESKQAILEEAEGYKRVLSDLKDFSKKYPDISDCTVDAVTHEEKHYSDGFSVTFHQNHTLDNPFGAYDDEQYAIMCAIARRELNADSVDIGVFGNPEVSFHCKDKDTAMRFAIEHNQNSIYDCSGEGKIIDNPKYDGQANPTNSGGED